MKRWLRVQGAALITSAGLRQLKRLGAALQRRLGGRQACIHYFHQVDDPYSDLAVRALPHLLAQYRVTVIPHLVPPPDPGAAPEPEKLADWSLRDAADLARGLGLSPMPWRQHPSTEAIQAAQSLLVDSQDPLAFAAAAEQIRTAFDQVSVQTPAQASAQTPAQAQASTQAQALTPSASAEAVQQALLAGQKRRQELGHYLGASFYFEGEWYWGLDRLPYLEERLRGLLRKGRTFNVFAARREVQLQADEQAGLPSDQRPQLEMFLSFRSPYTWIALPRAVALAKAWNAELRLRFVLPMVMRGLKVPLAKRKYIVMDTKREAERLGLPFGRIADPVGKPTERGLAVLHHAIAAGKGEVFALSFLRGVFAEGISAYTDKGLLKLCQRAGISEQQMQAALADDSWRAVAEANRADMFAQGNWGVPAFRVNQGQVYWGQDRLWLVEQELAATQGQIQAQAQAHGFQAGHIGTPLAAHATRVMLLGSGELGKEVVIELMRLGCEVIAVDRYANAPAMQVAHRSHVINMLDASALRALVEQERPQLIVPEIEAIATDELLSLEAEGWHVIPSARAARLTMNREGIRRLAAEELGLTTSPYRFAETEAEYRQAVQSIGYPCVVKPIMSSSGKGQSTVKSAADIERAWAWAQSGGRTGKGKVIVEGFVDFDYEITLLTVCHRQGTSFCAPIGHRQEKGDYRESWQPQAMNQAALQEAQRIAQTITSALGGYGIFGVEFFVKADTVYFSEVSPRPHDTGLVTLISQNLSEFALHARAILGLPIPVIRQLGPAASAVLLVAGDSADMQYGNLQQALAEADTDLRLFGKPEVRGERRLGVALARAESTDEAVAKALRVLDRIEVTL